LQLHDGGRFGFQAHCRRKQANGERPRRSITAN
jgi:hypothetical protein